VSAEALLACAVCAAGRDSQLGALLPAMLLLPYLVGWVAFSVVRPLLGEGRR
jgi:hypothetical protein